ncbi:methyltransferase domain-containing protein [Micromonospora sp. DT81.3]|uniref:methyltransferase domain-containing protein n=1 Tax=Micromonospora sp. DT81.3 TaxID=3416523 RepID=UPI003CE9861A
MTLALRAQGLAELMDDPDCDPARLARTLRRFGVINRLVAGWGTVYERHVRPALLDAGGSGRLLDIGCGAGDVLRRLVTRARADGFTVDAVGIDPDERGLAVAHARTPVAGIRYRPALSTELVAEGERFDVVVSNHVLHHLTAEQLTGLAQDSMALASRVALHSDIARGRTAYTAYAVGITPFAPGSFLRTDGLRSIRRSYTAGELRDALPEGWQVVAPVPFRVLARWDAVSG